MQKRLLKLAVATSMALVSVFAFAQGGVSTAPLSGLVVDTSGAPVPGAAVTVRDELAGTTYNTVSNTQGNFTVPALQAGTYSVSVSLSGFKTAVLKGNKLLAATPLAVKVVLAVGGMEETVLVEGGTPLVQTQSAAISNTIEANQIMTIPVASRSALDFLAFSPGISTPSGTRDSIISGLDQSAINITVDGMSIQDNFLKTTDGFFARLSPRLDMVEEMTLTTAAGNADNSGQGAAQVTFTTRRGTNEYHGSVYEYFRRDYLNANTWFNNRSGLPQAALKHDNYGFRFGGPIRIPGLFNGKDKAHFFINYEEIRIPADVTRNRNILSPAAQAGVFRYGGSEVNLLQLAGANGQLATTDPTIAKLLSDIRAATGKAGSIDPLADPNIERYSFQAPFSNVTKYPTARLDFQVTRKHLLTITGTLNQLLSDPDTLNGRDAIFPGFPVTGVQDSKRYIMAGTVRSTLSSNLINEFRVFGASGGATLFSTEINPSMWKGTSVADQAGFQLNINGVCCATVTTGTGNQASNINNASSGPAISSREASTKVLYDHMTWIKGSHSWSFGVDFTQVDVWLQNQTNVPTINFGIADGDPAAGLFTTANFPGASAANLNAARGLYSILTGRVQSIVGNARLDPSTDQYAYLGQSRAQGRMRQFDFFINDTWRAKPNLTLNYGLRYALQLPLYPLNNSYATATLKDIYGVSGEGNLFKPGVAGSPPVFVQYKQSEPANETDWNNFAPSLGVAWQPVLEGGFLNKLLGREPVLRAGFSMAYSRNGMSDFTDSYGENPGILIDVNRDQGLNNLGPVPLLFRDQARLGPPSFQSKPSYPLADVVTGDVRIFDPNLKIPYSQTWTASIGRQLGKKSLLEVRYVGSLGRGLWGNVNYNESNIVENGFLNEFRLAQQNLQANIRAGRGNSFAYYGPGTGTAPLPIYLAYFNGAPAGLAGDPTRYSGGSWSDTNFTNPLATFSPLPFTPAGTSTTGGLDGSAARRNNARTAGLPANFFRANPDLLGGAFVRTNRDETSYHAFETWFTRRYAKGLWFNVGYTFGKSYLTNYYSAREPRSLKTLNGGIEGGVTHGLKFLGGWDLPFGKGRKFAGNAGGLLDGIIGGWQLTGTSRLQSGQQMDFGNVRLVGMSKQEFGKMFKLRFDDAGRKIYMLPQDVIDNTMRAFNVSATSPTGYGAQGAPTGRYLAPGNGPDCIELVDPAVTQNNVGFGSCGGDGTLMVTGPMFSTLDLGIEKQFNIKGSLNLRIRAELLNAFNVANFRPVAANGTTNPGINTYTTLANYEVTQLNDSPRIAQLVARITW